MFLNYRVKREMFIAHMLPFPCYLFRKRRTKFHQNRPSFIEDVAKKTFRSLLFLNTL